MADLKRINKEIDSIKQRNTKVEADKSWETSITRRTLLMAFTYIAIGAYLHAINVPNAWLSAVVPSIGFMLSTLTLPFFKSIWLQKVYKK